MRRPSLRETFRRLLAAYGAQGWWPARTPFGVALGAILTQNTAWPNVEKALARLEREGPLEPGTILRLSRRRLEEALRPSGYFRQKAERVGLFCRQMEARWEGRLESMAFTPTADLREWLLSLKGIGPETADSILLYALGRPVFVVDAYTVRLLDRLGRLPGRGRYHEVQALFHRSLPREERLFNEFHALIVRHGKERCRKRSPGCGGCPLEGGCPSGRTPRYRPSGACKTSGEASP